MELYTQPLTNIALMESGNYLETPKGIFGVDIEADDIDVEDMVTVVWEIRD